MTVIGEALIDLVPQDARGSYHAHPGGSPFNVAVALARLGNDAALMARLGEHGFGRLLRGAAEAEGVDLGASPGASEPTTLAVVSLDEPGHATYDFYLQGTSDWHWTLSELRQLPRATAVLHYGSIASWTPPGSKIIDQVVSESRLANSLLVSYDPNVRAQAIGTAAHGRQLVERSVGRAHVVKASHEDVDWLYPARPIAEVAARWLELGAALVVVTAGAEGATAYRPGLPPLHREARQIKVVDTIGAGDAFSAGLLTGLVRRDLHTPMAVSSIDDADLRAVLGDAVLVSALTCERAGADPPRLATRATNGRELRAEDFAAR